MRLLLLLLLAGCATEADFARQAGTSAPNFPRLYVYTADVKSACIAAGARYAPGDIVHGCSDPWGRLTPKHCTVFLPHDAPTWLVEHEDLHCKYGNFHN